MRTWLIAAVTAVALSYGFAQTRPPAPRPTAASTPAKGAAKAVAAKPSPAEQVIFDSVNRERASRGLRPVKWNAALASAARLHAQKMAQAGKLSHQFPGEADMGTRIRVAGVRFTSVAENVAQGPSAAIIHQQWMNSPPHRSNMLDPEFDSLGVAVVERKGQLFAVQDFALISR